MKAWILEEIGSLKLQEKKMPVPGENEVLLRVKNCGICGSDVPRVFRDGAHHMPLVIGHEFSGEVAETGDGVSEKWKGKKVGVFPLIPCKNCGPCKGGFYEMCRNYGYLGSRQDGGFAEYTVVPQWNLIELPENVSFRQAAMLEPMAVASHALEKVHPEQWERAAVYGQGTIGLFLLMMLLERKVTGIYVFVNHDLQKKKALEFGLNEENICDTRYEDPVKWSRERTDGAGFDISIDAIGSNTSYSLTVENSAPLGRICLMGNPEGDMGLKRDTYWKILRNQLKLSGTWNSSFKSDIFDDWEHVLGLLSDGYISPEKVITHIYPMEEIEKGFEIMRDKSEEYIKILMEN